MPKTITLTMDQVVALSDVLGGAVEDIYASEEEEDEDAKHLLSQIEPLADQMNEWLAELAE